MVLDKKCERGMCHDGIENHDDPGKERMKKAERMAHVKDPRAASEETAARVL